MPIPPQICVENTKGFHNSVDSEQRLLLGKAYKDQSTICIIPTRGMIPAKVVQAWMSLMAPMNQKFIRIFGIALEVGESYSQMIEQILAHPDLKNWKYVLTLEEDNAPPPDGLLKLYEGMDDYDVIGGLYWTKGEAGQPMIYGDPAVNDLNFIPQVPRVDTIQPCNGLGMGFTLFKMDIFKDERVKKPWFETIQKKNDSGVFEAFTQDLYFFKNIRKLGYKVACDTRVKVGHFDQENNMMW